MLWFGTEEPGLLAVARGGAHHPPSSLCASLSPLPSRMPRGRMALGDVTVTLWSPWSLGELREIMSGYIAQPVPD